nr:hypothetical protein CFP56_36353 [Quercus suber]
MLPRHERASHRVVHPPNVLQRFSVSIMADKTASSSTLLSLPDELLDFVVVLSIPEGFESLALTSQRLLALCKPYINHHNELDRRYRRFSYGLFDQTYPFPITTAFHLITRIIVKPIVARYIRYANFHFDSQGFFEEGYEYDLGVEDGHIGRLNAFLSHSSVLKASGLIAGDLFHMIQEDVIQYRRYSQHSAALLLTMLPNIESLSLPQSWKPDAASETLLHAVTINNAALTSSSIDYYARLRNLKAFTSSTNQSELAQFEMAWAVPFLRSPRIASVIGYSFVDTTSIMSTPTPAALPIGIAANLKTVQLRSSCLTSDSLRGLLTSAPNLSSFCYQHAGKRGMTPDWSVSQFLNVIAHHAGDHLVKLSLRQGPHVYIEPALELSFRDRFPMLKALELPIGMIDCHSAEPEVSSILPGVHFSHLVPPSTVKVAFIDYVALQDTGLRFKNFFSGFPAEVQTSLPDLRELHISCPAGADEAYKLWCAELQQSCKQSSVSLRLQQFSRSTIGLTC